MKKLTYKWLLAVLRTDPKITNDRRAREEALWVCAWAAACDLRELSHKDFARMVQFGFHGIRTKDDIQACLDGMRAEHDTVESAVRVLIHQMREMGYEL